MDGSTQQVDIYSYTKKDACTVLHACRRDHDHGCVHVLPMPHPDLPRDMSPRAQLEQKMSVGEDGGVCAPFLDPASDGCRLLLSTLLRTAGRQGVRA